jgi:hypothetical protein
MKLKKPYTQYEGKLLKIGDGELVLLSKFIERQVGPDGPGVVYEHYSFGYRLSDPSNRFYKTTDIFADEFEASEIFEDEKEKLVKIVFEKKLEVT